jgi:hydrogenase nickel incorporation protein HypB
MILSKIDLLPYVPFDAELSKANARSVHPGIEIVEVSSSTGAGMAEWMKWIEKKLEEVKSNSMATIQ